MTDKKLALFSSYFKAHSVWVVKLKNAPHGEYYVFDEAVGYLFFYNSNIEGALPNFVEVVDEVEFYN